MNVETIIQQNENSTGQFAGSFFVAAVAAPAVSTYQTHNNSAAKATKDFNHSAQSNEPNSISIRHCCLA